MAKGPSPSWAVPTQPGKETAWVLPLREAQNSSLLGSAKAIRQENESTIKASAHTEERSGPSPDRGGVLLAPNQQDRRLTCCWTPRPSQCGKQHHSSHSNGFQSNINTLLNLTL